MRESYPEIYKELLELNNKMINNLNKQWAKDLSGPKGDLSGANKMRDTFRHQGNVNREAFGAGSSFGSVASWPCDRASGEPNGLCVYQTGDELHGLGSHSQSKILNLFATYMNLKFIAKEWFSLK